MENIYNSKKAKANSYENKYALVEIRRPHRIQDCFNDLEVIIDKSSRNNLKDIALNMANMAYISTADIGTLTGAYKKTLNYGLGLSLVNVKKPVQNFIKRSDGNIVLHKDIKIYDFLGNYILEMRKGYNKKSRNMIHQFSTTH